MSKYPRYGNFNWYDDDDGTRPNDTPNRKRYKRPDHLDIYCPNYEDFVYYPKGDLRDYRYISGYRSFCDNKLSDYCEREYYYNNNWQHSYSKCYDSRDSRYNNRRYNIGASRHTKSQREYNNNLIPVQKAVQEDNLSDAETVVLDNENEDIEMTKPGDDRTENAGGAVEKDGLKEVTVNTEKVVAKSKGANESSSLSNDKPSSEVVPVPKPNSSGTTVKPTYNSEMNNSLKSSTTAKISNKVAKEEKKRSSSICQEFTLRIGDTIKVTKFDAKNSTNLKTTKKVEQVVVKSLNHSSNLVKCNGNKTDSATIGNGAAPPGRDEIAKKIPAFDKDVIIILNRGVDNKSNDGIQKQNEPGICEATTKSSDGAKKLEAKEGNSSTSTKNATLGTGNPAYTKHSQCKPHQADKTSKTINQTEKRFPIDKDISQDSQPKKQAVKALEVDVKPYKNKDPRCKRLSVDCKDSPPLQPVDKVDKKSEQCEKRDSISDAKLVTCKETSKRNDVKKKTYPLSSVFSLCQNINVSKEESDVKKQAVVKSIEIGKLSKSKIDPRTIRHSQSSKDVDKSADKRNKGSDYKPSMSYDCQLSKSENSAAQKYHFKKIDLRPCSRAAQSMSSKNDSHKSKTNKDVSICRNNSMIEFKDKTASKSNDNKFSDKKSNNNKMSTERLTGSVGAHKKVEGPPKQSKPSCNANKEIPAIEKVQSSASVPVEQCSNARSRSLHKPTPKSRGKGRSKSVVAQSSSNFVSHEGLKKMDNLLASLDTYDNCDRVDDLDNDDEVSQIMCNGASEAEIDGSKPKGTRGRSRTRGKSCIILDMNDRKTPDFSGFQSLESKDVLCYTNFRITRSISKDWLLSTGLNDRERNCKTPCGTGSKEPARITKRRQTVNVCEAPKKRPSLFSEDTEWSKPIPIECSYTPRYEDVESIVAHDPSTMIYRDENVRDPRRRDNSKRISLNGRDLILYNSLIEENAVEEQPDNAAKVNVPKKICGRRKSSVRKEDTDPDYVPTQKIYVTPRPNVIVQSCPSKEAIADEPSASTARKESQDVREPSADKNKNIKAVEATAASSDNSEANKGKTRKRRKSTCDRVKSSAKDMPILTDVTSDGRQTTIGAPLKKNNFLNATVKHHKNSVSDPLFQSGSVAPLLVQEPQTCSASLFTVPQARLDFETATVTFTPTQSSNQVKNPSVSHPRRNGVNVPAALNLTSTQSKITRADLPRIYNELATFLFILRCLTRAHIAQVALFNELPVTDDVNNERHVLDATFNMRIMIWSNKACVVCDQLTEAVVDTLEFLKQLCGLMNRMNAKLNDVDFLRLMSIAIAEKFCRPSSYSSRVRATVLQLLCKSNAAARAESLERIVNRISGSATLTSPAAAAAAAAAAAPLNVTPLVSRHSSVIKPSTARPENIPSGVPHPVITATSTANNAKNVQPVAPCRAPVNTYCSQNRMSAASSGGTLTETARVVDPNVSYQFVPSISPLQLSLLKKQISSYRQIQYQTAKDELVASKSRVANMRHYRKTTDPPPLVRHLQQKHPLTKPVINFTSFSLNYLPNYKSPNVPVTSVPQPVPPPSTCPQNISQISHFLASSSGLTNPIPSVPNLSKQKEHAPAASRIRQANVPAPPVDNCSPNTGKGVFLFGRTQALSSQIKPPLVSAGKPQAAPASKESTFMLSNKNSQAALPVESHSLEAEARSVIDLTLDELAPDQSSAEFVDLENYFSYSKEEFVANPEQVFTNSGEPPCKIRKLSEGMDGDPIPRNLSNDSGLHSPEQIETVASAYENRYCHCGERACYVCPCREVMYCSTACQNQDWPTHSEIIQHDI